MCDVSYRDEREGMKARIDSLEGELSEAKQTISRLRGEGPAATQDGGVDWVSGVERRVELHRELPFEVSDEGFEAIADIANQRVPGGNVSQVGRTLTHRKALYELRVARGDGKTQLSVTGDYRNARVGMIAGGPGIALLSGVFSVGLLTALRLGPAPTAVLVVVLIVLALVGFRRLIQRNTAREQQTLRGLFEAVGDIAKQHRQPTRVRVDADAEEVAHAEDEAAEEEAEAAQRTP